MNQGYLPGTAPARRALAAHWWLAMLVVALLLAGAMAYLETKGLGRDRPLEQMFSYNVCSYAHLLLIGSSLLYVAHLWWRAVAVGLWASCLAALGALGLFVALALHASESVALHGDAHVTLTSLSEVMALFSGFTVLIYLAMEWVYRSRAAGAFVMPVVVAAVLFQAWLSAQEHTAGAGELPLLLSYEVRAHVLTNLVAYGAFTVAAALGAMYLLRQHAERHSPALGLGMRALLDPQRTERLMHSAVTLGFPLFSAAILLGMVAARNGWGRYWAWDPKETWSFVVWSVYAVYFCLHYLLRWRGRRMALWVIAGFGLALSGFFGVNLLFARLHVFG